MLNKFRIAETEEYAKLRKKSEYEKLFKKIDAYDYKELKENPFQGSNIKKLKGEFKDIYRYRSGNFRIFYIVDNENVIIIMLTIQQRKNAYKRGGRSV